MKCHQILTGACNAGDRCFSVGSVEGISFTAYAAGCNIVILASNFERVQVIPGVCHDNVQISCVDCSTDTGKIAAAYGKLVCVFEPTPLTTTGNTQHRLDYHWIQTGVIEAESYINTMGWNLEGTRLLTAGEVLQLWASPCAKGTAGDYGGSGPVMFDLGSGGGGSGVEVPDEEEPVWDCIWRCVTAAPTVLLSFSPDGTLFATSAANDRLVKIWYDNKHMIVHAKPGEGTNLAADLTKQTRAKARFSYIYLPHPSAVKGFTWRTTSKYMPKASVSNMLVTSCRDNICRIWVETILPDDGLVSLQQLDPVASQNPRFRTHRHKHKFMQRLKHVKACFQMRKQVKSGGSFMMGGLPADPLPTVPSTYSVHDYHMYGIHASGMTPGFHFHLAASINAETDIPLVPSISGITTVGDSEQSFVLHWLNNKEMNFTSEAENILLEVSRRALEKETTSLDHDVRSEVSHSDTEQRAALSQQQRFGSRTPSHMAQRARSIDDDDPQSQSASVRSHQPLSAATSSTSIATDVTMATTAVLGDALDRRIDTLLRDWHQTSDVLFSIHPVDGSLLVWIVDFLDDHPGSFRQAQVSFSARIPNALPLGDAMSMSPNLAIYNGTTSSFIKQLLKMELQHEEESRGTKMKSNLTLASNEVGEGERGSSWDNPSPVISMTTKHSNGSLNLWHITVAEGSRFSQVLNISYFTRVCGHRFQLNDIKCHPVLPLLLSTSHHNKREVTPREHPTQNTDDTPLICIQDSSNFKDWCSELILWRVDAVGPLSKSGGVTELARINSPQLSAFSNIAWIPTLLPSVILGSISNSPSACFVASDGECLSVYQAVIDGRTLLAEISTAERKKAMMESTLSLSTDSSLQEQAGQMNLTDIFKVVSEQSTARPGCIIQLNAIGDATNDWQHTQFLHVFQEGLIRGDRPDSDQEKDTSMFHPAHAPIIDLHSHSAFEEPFYITLLEKTKCGSVMHMWHLIIASEHGHGDNLHHSGHSTPIAEHVHAQQALDASPVVITTKKICAQELALPAGVSVIHCAPAAGHLSSASIYPACYAPYVLVTACSDNTVRFWRCRMTGEGDNLQIQWLEWNMVSKDAKSVITIPGRPLHVSAAYSGRIACAYETPGKENVVSSEPNGNISFACSVAIYECESTGGSQWVLEDKFDLHDLVSGGSSEPDLSHLCEIASGKSAASLRFAATAPQPDDQGQILVPSFSTLHTLRNNRFDKKGVNVKQKHPVQIDWVSKEDGSHLLTVAVGSKIQAYTSVADEVAMMAVSGDTTETTEMQRTRPSLQKSISMHQITGDKLPRWMRLEKLNLCTADGMAPLPMQVSWVRDGILVVGMDSEMHVYSQWHHTVAEENAPSRATNRTEEDIEDGSKQLSRDLTSEDLKNYLQENSASYKSHPTVSRVASYSVLASLDNKNKKSGGESLPVEEMDLFTAHSGVFEASHILTPVLPQYHPQQLMELLNSGKIRRVKAIIAHLLRCLSSMGHRSTEVMNRSSLTDGDDFRSRTFSRSRALSVAGPQAGSREGRGSLTLSPGDLTLDYIAVTAIPPLPLWLLLEADKDIHPSQQSAKQENKDDTYAELFGGPSSSLDDEDLTLEEEELDLGGRRKSITDHQPKGLAYFGPRQTQMLANLLTHTHLPGLSSLDQMHLLALADTVASCNIDFADRFDINKAKEMMAKETYSRSATDEPSMDSLDDCGLRFLLAMRHHTYLLRCIPVAQRATQQKEGIGSHNFVWAYHSESQEELLDFISSVRQGNPRWSELRELGFGWWVRNNNVMSKCIQKVAKAAFQVRNDPLDAAIYYMAMKKKNLVWGLFRSISDKRMTEFFAHNFTEERWRQAALKNAFALLGKQRFAHAASFFLLAGSLKDAIEVILNKLQDVQLAMVVIRMYEGELEATPPSLIKLMRERVLGMNDEGQEQDIMKLHPDPFIRSLTYWMLKDYAGSLNTLLQTDLTLGIHHPQYQAGQGKGSRTNVAADPRVFNFYIYLRTHPLLIRQCIANSAKDSGPGALMASLLGGAGQDSLNKKAVYESSMTTLERRLYFTTAHAHLRSGCPTLALEVLSKLPDNVIDTDNPESGDLLGSPSKEPRASHELIKSGTLDLPGDSFDGNNKGQNTAAALFGTSSSSQDTAAALFAPASDSNPFAPSGGGFDWSSPMTNFQNKQEDELDLDFSIDTGEDEEEKKPEKPTDLPVGNKRDDDGVSVVSGSVSSSRRLDIMAQQLKFVSCLKMMMEELATLATGCEVDGGQLRYQLYVWLEREVEALKEVCNYRSHAGGNDLVETSVPDDGDRVPSPTPVAVSSEPATLHEILQQEKVEFEAKLERAARRKRWLMANQQLLRTLLSYCSLHGSSGGGLANVRMELILLLQELQQESSKQQLLSPLPFPTTLPLLSASIASNKTVVSDPIRHLQAGTHDLLQSLVDIGDIGTIGTDCTIIMRQATVLRNLAAALSDCIYQSLCDSETFTLKTQPSSCRSKNHGNIFSLPHPYPGVEKTHMLFNEKSGLLCPQLFSSFSKSLQEVSPGLGMDIQQMTTVTQRDYHLVGRDPHSVHVAPDETLQVCTPPAKWPGVTSLLALVARERDEDTPKLNILLCEAFLSVYLSLLVHGLAASDAFVLYRLTAQRFTEKEWGNLFGGGVKKMLKVITNVLPTQSTSESPTVGSPVSAAGVMNTFSNLQKTRMKINMKILGQLGFQDPSGRHTTDGESKPAFREQFLPPDMSIVSHLMKKPSLVGDLQTIDYDSSASDEEDYEEDYEDDEDVFKEPKILADNTEHSDTDSYSWCLLRLACVRMAQTVVSKFLEVAGLEFQELPQQSPLLHSILRTMERWLNSLVDQLESKKGPPPEYIPGCFADTYATGPAILKYRGLLEKHNTPFARNKAAVKPVERLWNYLVRQEEVQDTFVRYIFGRKRPAPEPIVYSDPGDDEESEVGDATDGDLVSEAGAESSHQEASESGGPPSESPVIASLEPVRIIHKDQDSCTTFCINKVNPGLMAVATVREVQELDVSLLLDHPSWLTNECELDVLALNKDPETVPNSNFMVVQTPMDKNILEGKGGDGGMSSSSSINYNIGMGSQMNQTGRGASVILSHRIEGTRRMTSHPVLPLYLLGCQDGSVVVREWHHSSIVARPRPGGTFAKVARVRFNQQGNKFGVIDGDGNLSLYQLGLASQINKPFYNHQCHNKHGSDFVFVGSSSLLATAGQSSEHRNVGLWDTLMPQRKANVISWTCHENGASALLYAPQHQILLSAGKKGTVCIFDVRNRSLRHKFQAHDAPIKCMALDQSEEFFCTGSADGDIKVWGLSVHNLIYNLPGEHSRSSLFKNLSQGVTQLHLDNNNRLFSCGADGSIKLRQLPERDLNVTLM